MKTKTELINKAWKLLALVAFVLGSFTMYSCGDDDDEKEGIDGGASIVGTWEFEKGYYAEYGVGEDRDGWWEPLEKGDYDRWTFYDDGTYVHEDKYSSFGQSYRRESGSYIYREYDSRTELIIYDNTNYSDRETYKILTLNGSTLVLEEEEMMSGYIIYSKEYFKRKK